jgi:hypothetical protein
LNCEICGWPYVTAQGKTALQDNIDRITDIERCYGMGINVQILKQ